MATKFGSSPRVELFLLPGPWSMRQHLVGFTGQCLPFYGLCSSVPLVLTIAARYITQLGVALGTGVCSLVVQSHR